MNISQLNNYKLFRKKRENSSEDGGEERSGKVRLG